MHSTTDHFSHSMAHLYDADFQRETDLTISKQIIGKIMQKRHRIQFPKTSVHTLNQDETYFFLQGAGKDRKMRFHDYNEIYQVPGLYEQLFYDRLKCTSPSKVASILRAAVDQKSSYNFTELRILDLGAGN